MMWKRLNPPRARRLEAGYTPCVLYHSAEREGRTMLLATFCMLSAVIALYVLNCREDDE